MQNIQELVDEPVMNDDLNGFISVKYKNYETKSRAQHNELTMSSNNKSFEKDSIKNEYPNSSVLQ